MTMSFFASVALWQFSVLILLYCVILKYFKGELDREYRLLVACQSVLAVGYILRFALIILVINNNWIDFTRDYPNRSTSKADNFQWAALPLQFTVYAIIPYMTIILAHWRNAGSSDRTELDRSRVSANISETLDGIHTSSIESFSNIKQSDHSLMVKYVQPSSLGSEEKQNLLRRSNEHDDLMPVTNSTATS